MPPFLLEPVVLTSKVAVLSMLLHLLIGVPLGLLLAGKRNLFKHCIEVAVTLPMIFPPMASGFFLLVLLGKNGFIGKAVVHVAPVKIIFSFWGLLVAAFIVGLPFMVKSVQTARRQLGNGLVDAAATLGKSGPAIFLQIVLPNIIDGIVTGTLLSFGRALGEVGISLMLGGNIIGRTETLSLAIYNAVFEGDYRRAALLSLILSVIALAVISGLTILNSRTAAD
jgi:molybdate transport system permease protein